jgi:hypothetical protein
MNPLSRARPAWKRGVLFCASFLMEKNADGLMVLSGGRVTVAALTVVWGVSVWSQPSLLNAWPAAWLGCVLAFALRVHIDLEILRPGAAVGLMEKIVSRAGRGTGVSQGYSGLDIEPWEDDTPAPAVPSGGTDDQFYGKHPVTARPQLATGEPIPRPEAPLLVPHVPAVTPVVVPAVPRPPRGIEMETLASLLRANGIRHFSAEELAQPGNRHSSGVVNQPPPRDILRNIVPTVRVLEWLRARVGHPVEVLSGYRDPVYNRAVGSTDTSMHPAFAATDIRVPGMSAAQVFAILETHPEASRFGLGLYPSANLVHVDTRGALGRNAPARWQG